MCLFDNFCTTKEIANHWNVSRSTVQRYCKEKIIVGLVNDKGKYYIPRGTEKPNPINIKGVLGEIKIQEDDSLSQESVKIIFDRQEVSDYINYFLRIGFITNALNLGENRFKLTETGNEYLLGHKTPNVFSSFITSIAKKLRIRPCKINCVTVNSM